MMRRGLSTKCKQLAAITALAMGPACADMDDAGDREPLLEDEEGEPGERPDAPANDLTTYDRASAVPGFALGITLGGPTGQDVVLDWSGNGFSGDVMVYRSTDPTALLEITLDAPLAPGVEGVMVNGVTSWTDPGAASRTAQTPNYFYRVGLVQNGELGTQLQLSTMVMKTTTATGPGFNRFGLCMLGGPTSASQLAAMFGPSVIGVHQRIPGGPDFLNFRSWTPGGGEDFALEYGAGVVAQFNGTADPYHSLVGVVPTSESMAVSAEPGYNWMTLPVFYDGPTSSGYWVDTVGYWGVGAWNNLTQGSTWDWQDPGYAPFEMEPCGTYDVFLRDDACSSNADCPADEFCFFVEAAACGDVGSGLCFPRPPGCEGVPESPVCGCDGQTYASQCEADLAGVGVAGADGADGQGTLVFDFEGGSPVLEGNGGWMLYEAAPPSYQNSEVPFPSQVLGTDGNRIAPYPGNDNENSFATLGPITLGTSLSLSSWHVDEGGSYYDRKRVYFVADGGQTWVLADCAGGINADQAFCQFNSTSRPGDLWDEIVFDTEILAGQTGTLRFEYTTLDGCCSFEQGWFIDDIRVNGCNSADPTSGPPVPAPTPNECPAQCLDMFMYEQLVLDPAAGPITACYQNDYGEGGNAQIDGEGGYAAANWNDFGSGSCQSYSPELGYQSYNLSNTQAEACGDLIEAQIAALGPACNGPQPACGDGNVDPGEQCDGGNLDGQSCVSQGFGSGTLACTAECTFDTAACVPIGGGGGSAEVCEAGADPLSGMPWVVCAADASSAWVSHSNPGGGNFHPQLICNSLGYDTFASYGGTCGNVCGYCEGATSCDAPGNQSFDGAGDCGTDAGGQVLCNTVMWECVNDGAPPQPVCGNGVLESGEQCDGGQLNGATCGSLGLGGGNLSCSAACTYDTSACVPFGGGGGSAEVCEAGQDPVTGDPWVVCAVDGDSAWVSHSNAGGGNYHAEQICASLGYGGVGSFGGTCGNVCGYCEGATSCDDPGNQNFDGAGNCGIDANGQVFCYTVMWECVNPLAA